MNNTEPKQYAHRDIMALDKLGGHYCRHVMALTAEGLHTKSDIAAELAWRDARIAELQTKGDALAEGLRRVSERLAEFKSMAHASLAELDPNGAGRAA